MFLSERFIVKLILILLSLNVLMLIVKSSELNADNQQDANSNRNKDCKYEKEPWDECNLNTGTQKRTLKLKTVLNNAQCETVKEITRTCKKACRYTKGVWSECLNEEKTRIDTLKPNLNGASDCDATRVIEKKCKQPSTCKYIKSDWSACKKGVKSKTLELESGDSNKCDSKKIITKQCSHPKKVKNSVNSRRIARKNKGKKDRNDNKKISSTTEDASNDTAADNFKND